MKYYLLLLLLTCGLFFGCGSDEPQQSGSAQELLPLAIGNKWEYFDESFDEDGFVIDRTDSKYEITSSRTYLGHEVFQFTLNDDSDFAPIAYYTGTTEATKLIDNRDSIGKVVLHSPMTEGQSVVVDNHDDQLHTWTLKEANILLSVTSGLFRCFHFEDSTSSKVCNYWYCKNVGLIKEEDYEHPNGKRFLSFKSEITSFTIY